MFCEICNKPETEWEKPPTLTFAFTLKGERIERYICAECTLQRLIELSKESEKTNV